MVLNAVPATAVATYARLGPPQAKTVAAQLANCAILPGGVLSLFAKVLPAHTTRESRRKERREAVFLVRAGRTRMSALAAALSGQFSHPSGCPFLDQSGHRTRTHATCRPYCVRRSMVTSRMRGFPSGKADMKVKSYGLFPRWRYHVRHVRAFCLGSSRRYRNDVIGSCRRSH
jgi:hypothetical protein